MSQCGLCGGALTLTYPKVRIGGPSDPPLFRAVWGCARCPAYWTTLKNSVGSGAYHRDKPQSDHALLEGGQQRFRKVRRPAERALGQHDGYRLLDVGCAGGAHFEVYGPGIGRFGVEPALSCREMQARRDAVWLGPSVEDAPAAGFDVVTCLDVLEHLPDPMPLLDGIDRALRPGGVLVLVTGDIESFSARWAAHRWAYYALPEHCSFYSARALKR